MEEKKTNTQLLKEMQDIADEIGRKKNDVELLLNVIDVLEIKYHHLAETIKKQSANG